MGNFFDIPDFIGNWDTIQQPFAFLIVLLNLVMWTASFIVWLYVLFFGIALVYEASYWVYRMSLEFLAVMPKLLSRPVEYLRSVRKNGENPKAGRKVKWKKVKREREGERYVAVPQFVFFKSNQTLQDAEGNIVYLIGIGMRTAPMRAYYVVWVDEEERGPYFMDVDLKYIDLNQEPDLIPFWEVAKQYVPQNNSRIRDKEAQRDGTDLRNI
ncbi:hypothetical protein [Thermicanus aegyptius]|uniref:hypothetical protein n=1 Tax=Thermicanus aegyptius TaxID=94009 RepID=UPI00048EA277|nr:hypothetical protein [Thermicanus aegyptius]